MLSPIDPLFFRILWHPYWWEGKARRFILTHSFQSRVTVGKLIFMNDRTTDGVSQKTSLRDRRYAIRFPFAADAEVLDLESGVRTDGITSDISLGGVFVCTSKPLAVKTRARVTLKRKGESIEAFSIVRIVKPRIGMGLEFLDIESTSNAILTRWLEQLRRGR